MILLNILTKIPITFWWLKIFSIETIIINQKQAYSREILYSIDLYEHFFISYC